MKKLGKLQINSGKILKNEELITLRGGWGMAKCVMPNYDICWCGRIEDCDDLNALCDSLPQCNGWEYGICAGW